MEPNKNGSYPKLDLGLENETKLKGFNGKIYTLYELRNSANNYKTSDNEKYRKSVKDKHERVYNCRKEIIPSNILEEVYGLDKSFYEEWKLLPEWFFKLYNTPKFDYKVSNLGRLKVGSEFLTQEAYKDGYLVISKENKHVPEVKNHSIYIYNFISAAFFGIPTGYVIHHINNNGYDCRPDNLILLTPLEHSKAHGWPIGINYENLEPINNDFEQEDPVDYAN